MKPQVARRLLGYMLLEAPTAEGRDNVTSEIASCGEDETRLKQLAQLYAAVYIQTFKTNEGRTPIHMDETSPDSSENEEKDVPPSEERHWEARQNASKRDRHRCILSHSHDLRYMLHLLHTEPGHPLLIGPVPCGPVEEARIIIPIERKTDITDNQQAKLEYPTRTILSRFGKTNIFEDLNVDDLNHMSNVMSLGSAMHRFFDGLHMCLVAVEGQPNTYRIEAFVPGVLFTIPENPVTFTTSDEKILPLPSPVLLALHRACVRVAHFSGGDQYVDDLLD
ncbi:hypothetical protein EDD85DRAFT_951344 [Armillaria nabsnona]|nr:hypothetical protein EDD85DRAFT_951344 [Armillaria nabsnona]